MPITELIKKRMQKAHIPGLSIAYLDAKQSIKPEFTGTTDVHAPTPHVAVDANTVFGAASLSKPVFSYLVLKLIRDKKITLPDGTAFGLDTPLAKILPIATFYKEHQGKEVSAEFAQMAASITPRMVLSHTTGIPISGDPLFTFKPGTAYAYGGIPLCYMQKAIEQLTGKTLEQLAQEEVFTPLAMGNSSFMPPKKEGDSVEEPGKGKLVPPIAANSLHTTPSDYAHFASAWMKEMDCGFIKSADTPTLDSQKSAPSSRYILTETGFYYYQKAHDNGKNTLERLDLNTAQLAALHALFAQTNALGNLSNEQMESITGITGHSNPLQMAFRPAISLTKDKWAEDRQVSLDDRSHLAWGLGLGLQTDGKGKVTTAFHSGDMNQWRGWVAMDLSTKSAVVYMANSDYYKNGTGHGYGHILADLILPMRAKLDHALNWFFKKFDVCRDFSELHAEIKKDGASLVDSSAVTQHFKNGLKQAVPQSGLVAGEPQVMPTPCPIVPKSRNE